MKNLRIAIVALFFAFCFAVFFFTRPSGDIDDYKPYFVNDVAEPKNGSIKVTFFGVSTLLFDDGETQLLIDGYFTRTSMLPLLLKNLKSDTALIDDVLAKHSMNRVKAIFATHSHFDHALDVAYTAKRTGATLYGSISTLNIGHGGGVEDKKLALFQANDEFEIGKFKVKIIRSKHSQPNTLADDGIVIEKPLPQPAKIKAYSEGGSYDFMITHGDHHIFVKPSANFVEGALDSLKADAVFVGISAISKQTRDWQNQFYEQTIGKLNPQVVVPLHWDDFTKPLSDKLVMLPKFANNSPADFEAILPKINSKKIDFRILQGKNSILLFKSNQ